MKKLFYVLLCTLMLCAGIGHAAEYVVKEDTDEWFPVILLDSTDGITEVTSKAFGDTTVEYAYEAATSWSTYTDDANTFKENGDGVYWLQMGASEFADNGRYVVRIEVPGCITYRFLVTVTDSSRNETVASVNNIEADTAAQDTSSELRTLLTGSDTAVSTLTAAGVWETNVSAYSGAGYAGTYLKNLYDNQGNWLTATGFSTHSAADVVTAMQAVASDFKADVSGLSTFDYTSNQVTVATNNDKTGYALSAAGVDAVWDEVITGHSTADSFGKVFDDQIDGLRTYGDTNWLTATGFSTHSAADVWAVGTRTITDKTGFSLSAAGIDAIWDEAQSGHTSAGTFGKYLDAQVSAVSAPSAADVADAVWDEAIADHSDSGSTGEALTNASAAGNPWATDISTGYDGQAGEYMRNVYNATDGDKESGEYTGVENLIRRNR